MSETTIPFDLRVIGYARGYLYTLISTAFKGDEALIQVAPGFASEFLTFTFPKATPEMIAELTGRLFADVDDGELFGMHLLSFAHEVMARA